MSAVHIRPARAGDVRAIADIVRPYVRRRILVAKDLIDYFEDVQEFVVAQQGDEIVGCGALHVFWEDIGEIRTLAVKQEMIGQGVGKAIVAELEDRARELGLRRLFCLTFEIDFFESRGYEQIEGTPVGVDVYQQILRSHDDGTAEFLDLARVKPNTLGNYRMLKEL
ncbi:amino-acid N-acetyltransferase [Trueperella bialowiezensis]|uniref:Amino-acid acetyltransferase n=1 Tax=Trueperella bialowiezensis TaxID=312285 RepID=A0A448PFF6_9ACTO|nr:amino-acid N-acetyltransferase [Trueperella bialowiezensis]VEI13675.1 Amino-acid acetyltransferase [Trueperella bialowiezensis]